MDITLPTNPEILKLISQIDQFRGFWASGSAVPPDRLARLHEATRVQSVAASCRIAGIRVAESEVAAVLSGSTTTTALQIEIEGYATAVDRAFPHRGPLVTAEEIGILNAVLMGKPGDPPLPSAMREVPIHLEVFDADGRALGRVLQTLPPRLLRDKMEDLDTWLEIELRSGDHHPLLVIGAVFIIFTAISPYERGNGRTARAMVPHLLRRAGYGFADYASLERVFDEMRLGYYDAIDASQTKLWTEEADLTPWEVFFLRALALLATRLQAKVDLEVQARELPPLQRAILETIREHGTGAASLLLASTGANRNTLKDNLRRLVDRGLLERIGSKRGTFYRIATGEAPMAISMREEAP
jgi:Fic family protein